MTICPKCQVNREAIGYCACDLLARAKVPGPEDLAFVATAELVALRKVAEAARALLGPLSELQFISHAEGTGQEAVAGEVADAEERLSTAVFECRPLQTNTEPAAGGEKT